MANSLCIPISLDALYLPTPRAVVQAHADFSRLPYVDKSKTGNWLDVNPGTPYLSEEILLEPLQDEGLYLQPGVHLHWALPDALTRALQTQDEVQWPTAPNRWLVTRSRNGIVEQQWVVESDYLWPEGSNAPESITFPVTPAAGQSQPYRYMGRQLLLNDWLNPPSSQPTPEYFAQLTAMGYGDPNFAALYPNCHSVFGFHDLKFPAKDDLVGLQYDVIGWYANPDDDFLHPANSFWLQEAFNATRAHDGLAEGAALDADQMYEALQNEFDWQVSAPSNDFPQRLLCYASLVFDLTNATESDDYSKEIKIAVGNTGAEALSAYLAATTKITTNPAKAIVEDQLEALLLQSEGQNHQLDWTFKFREARHEKGFSPFAGGAVWSVRPNAPGAQTGQDAGPDDQQAPLPLELARLLNRLNQQQQSLDRANDQADDLRRLLYADWCKYQRCSHPPEDSPASYPQPDEARYFVQQKDMLLLQREWTQVQAYTSICAETRNVLNAGILSFNQDKQANPKLLTYQLQATPGQRYWRANDPALLLAGPGIRPTPRHDEDGALTCKVLQADLPSNTDASAASLRSVVNGETPTSWIGQPWNPYLLEWEVELMPVEDSSNIDTGQYAYDPNYIGCNFELQVDQIDLTVLPGKAKVARAANIYSGRSILTPQAGQNLNATLKNWLDGQNHIDDASAWLDQQTDPAYATLKENLVNQYKNATGAYIELATWLGQQNQNPQATGLNDWLTKQYSQPKDPAYDNILVVYNQLQVGGEYYQSQSLGGFHEALLMQQQTLQLPLQDPLAFDDHKDFATQVEQLVGDGNLTAPEPLNEFNPIRAGVMRLLTLRLVDTFGRTRALVTDGDADYVTTAEPLVAPGQDNLAWLPPRLAQPARLDFHWLAANGDDLEMNSHPATSPVCGWLLPNNLDGTLLVYEQGGGVLGWIEEADGSVVWQPAPGADLPVSVDTIPNPHLQNVVRHILAMSKADPAYFEHFRDAVETALEGIDPESFAQHESLALLMGRPIAVARASLKLELKGLPAIDHDWNRFRQDLENVSTDTPRANDNFTAVTFPIRLGDYRQLNDGLVGYWAETEDGFENDTFYSPQSADNPSPKIETSVSGKMNRHHAIDSAPETYTMLLDPRGVVHAHCGILPARALVIPSDQFSAALKAIQVFFLSTPILTPAGQLTLPLPDEPGFTWSWFGRQNGVTWQTVDSLAKPNLQATFAAQQQIVEGWLKLSPDDQQ